ncbi:uncharacterized protein LOC141608224 [Silene latifolia]|uniref:uncharacterized protein LOC141608224 n=1 Tax=Silene latifolia TaxID=37657 RepID=UPI003D7778DB
MYSSILDAIDTIGEISSEADIVKAESISYALRTFDFVFVTQLMVTIFGRIRDDGWDAHMEKVSAFCFKHGIDIPNMNDLYVIPGRHRRGRREVDNLKHFRAEVFMSVIDQILSEFNDRFNEKSKELLVCMSCFNPQNRFASFDTKKLRQLAEFYPSEFSRKDLLYFEYQLDTFKYDVQTDDRFWNLKTLNELSMKLVETMKHLTHSKVYMLLKLVLVLPVATQ